MRLVFVCTECATHYLPPESMQYPHGPASPVHCSVCQRIAAELGVEVDPRVAAAALALARRAARARADGAAEEPRPDVRPSRPARTRRAGRPQTGRSKLA